MLVNGISWVAGALNSGWRAVYVMLLRHYPRLIAKFKKEWGDSEEWDDRTLAKHTLLAHELTKLSLELENDDSDE